jgi:hypothetical protein
MLVAATSRLVCRAEPAAETPVRSWAWSCSVSSGIGTRWRIDSHALRRKVLTNSSKLPSPLSLARTQTNQPIIRDAEGIPFGNPASSLRFSSFASLYPPGTGRITEFPAGSTAFTPSAIAARSIALTQPDERGCSFTQYGAEGTLRLYSNGFHSDEGFLAQARRSLKQRVLVAGSGALFVKLRIYTMLNKYYLSSHLPSYVVSWLSACHQRTLDITVLCASATMLHNICKRLNLLALPLSIQIGDSPSIIQQLD